MQKQVTNFMNKRHELEIEHRFKNQVVGRRILKPTADMTVIGSSATAQLRLIGEDVSGIHAVIEFDQETWSLNDLGSDRGTWIDKKPIVTKEISEELNVRIGSHELRLIPHVFESELFDPKAEYGGEKGHDLFHQVVVRKAGTVVQTHTLSANQTFVLKIGTERVTLPPPSKQGNSWVTHEFGDVTLQQRLIKTNVIRGSAKEELTSLFDGDLRWPAIGACILGALFVLTVAFAPKQEVGEAKFLVPSENKYTKIIFDAKTSQKAQKQAETVVKNIQSKQAPVKQTAAAAQPKASAPKASPATPPKRDIKVVSSIKASGLSQLVGKVSKRASQNAVLIQGAGSASGAHASLSIGQTTASTLGGTQNIKGGGSFKIGGIGTLGKAGGDKGYAKQGALATGSVGESAVGMLEEESEVQGGLDKEEIARVIRAQLGEIRYCYERQLSANPDLFGKVLVKFTINASGAVASQNIRSTTLSNAMVEGCMLRRIANWKFPKPVGGTNVIVSYPFLFKSTN